MPNFCSLGSSKLSSIISSALVELDILQHDPISLIAVLHVVTKVFIYSSYQASGGHIVDIFLGITASSALPEAQTASSTFDFGLGGQKQYYANQLG